MAICTAMVVRELRIADAMRRAHVFSLWFRCVQRWVALLAPCVIVATLLQGCLDVQLTANGTAAAASAAPPPATATAAIGTLLLMVQLLHWLQHWSMSFAMFVECLGMIMQDLGHFFVVLLVILLGFSWCLPLFF